MSEFDRSLIYRLEQRSQILEAKITLAQWTADNITDPTWTTTGNKQNPRGTIPNTYLLDNQDSNTVAKNVENREWTSELIREYGLPKLLSEFQLVSSYATRLREDYSLLDETQMLINWGLPRVANFRRQINDQVIENHEEIERAAHEKLIILPKITDEDVAGNEEPAVVDRRGIPIPTPHLTALLLNLSPKEAEMYSHIYQAKTQRDLITTSNLANAMYPDIEITAARGRVSSILSNLRDRLGGVNLDIPGIIGGREDRYDISYFPEFIPTMKQETIFAAPTAKEIGKEVHLSQNEYFVYGLIRLNRSKGVLIDSYQLAQTIFDSDTDESVRRINHIINNLRTKLSKLDLRILFTETTEDKSKKGYDIVSKSELKKRREQLNKKSISALSYFIDGVPNCSIDELRDQIDVDGQLVYPTHVVQSLEKAIRVLSRKVLAQKHFNDDEYDIWIKLRKGIDFQPGNLVLPIILSRINEWYKSQKTMQEHI